MLYAYRSSKDGNSITDQHDESYGIKANRDNGIKAQQIKSNNSNQVTESVVIVLSVTVTVLALVVVAYFCYQRRRKKPPSGYRKISTTNPPIDTIITPTTLSRHPSLKPKPSLSLPKEVLRDSQEDISGGTRKKENLTVRFDDRRNTPPPPPTPSTPITPNTPLFPLPIPPHLQKKPLGKSISLPAKSVMISKDAQADGMWRNSIKKASNSRFLQSEPGESKRIRYCLMGKIKFSLTYDIRNQSELTVTIIEFIDLPLSRETGISVPFVKVYLYPQTAHTVSLAEVSKNLDAFKLEILNFPTENSCTFYGCPIDKLCSCALKFVILDYDRFSRSEFVSDCVVLLDEVSLEGEAITKHLSVRKTHMDKDVGSLLISLCYQPNVSRMTIIVLKASGLPESESGSAPDHFVKISLMRNNSVLDKRRTRVIKKTVSPVFNERLVFPINIEDIRSLVFVFELIRYDSKLKQEKIANVVLGYHSNTRQVTPHEIQHFNEMLDSPQRQIAEWHKLVT